MRGIYNIYEQCHYSYLRWKMTKIKIVDLDELYKMFMTFPSEII